MLFVSPSLSTVVWPFSLLHLKTNFFCKNFASVSSYIYFAIETNSGPHYLLALMPSPTWLQFLRLLKGAKLEVKLISLSWAWFYPYLWIESAMNMIIHYKHDYAGTVIQQVSG